MMRFFKHLSSRTRWSLPCVLLVFFAAVDVRGQSTDVGFPTPVVSNEIVGRIAPRDLGDARLTRYFYAFTGREGDLVITVESANIDGAVDLFTGSTLRPLAKISLYAGASSNKAAKSVYLRREEPLILRVEARTAGDADGNFRIQFEGAFTPLASAETGTTETPATSSAETSRRAASGGRRVTSIGARIPETEEEKAARLEREEKERARREELAAEAKAKSDAIAAEKDTARLEKERLRLEEQKRKEALRASAAAARNARRSEALRRSQPAKTDSARTDAAKPPAPVASADATRNRARPGATSRPSTSRGRASRARIPAPPKATEAATSDATKTPEVKTEQPVAGARLIIETRDGSRLVREMNTVRRVTIENNQIVVVGRDGRIERQPMTNVLRMSIEP
ncbi:MAG: hypothetical protein M3R15_16820 [Acidobacteriota bacterium]|nr:hypothetical protein [Acidobacteriota bacterium]